MANIPVGTPPATGTHWKGWASSLRLWLAAHFAAINHAISDLGETLTLDGLNTLFGSGLVTLKDFAETRGGEIGYANNAFSIDLADGTMFFAPADVRGHLTGGIHVDNSGSGKRFTIRIHNTSGADINITKGPLWRYKDGNTTLKNDAINIIQGFVFGNETFVSISQFS